MRGSFRLLKAFDININVHVTFLILPFLFMAYGIRGVFFILFVFLCVTLHELTHSLVAKKFGIGVKEITLLPFGGLASMTSYPEKPVQEFLISLAGPAFNIVFASVLYLPITLIFGKGVLFAPSLATWPQVIAQCFWANLVLAGFNLLPAFPMDGGRLLRSILASRMPYRKATSIAVNIGHVFALVFGYLGVVHRHIFLIAIAFFIYMAASAEDSQVDVRETIKKYRVRDVLPSEFLTLQSNMPLAKVLDVAFHSQQKGFPIIDNRKLVGLLTRTDIIANMHKREDGGVVGDMMRTKFPVVLPEELLSDVQKKMEDSELRALPVVKSGRTLGIIALEDISRVYSMMSKRNG